MISLPGVTLATPLPWWALPVLAAAVAWLAVRTYSGLPLAPRRRVLLTGIRALTLLTLVIFLLRPVVIRPAPSEGFTVPIVIDASRSMAIPDAPGGQGLAEAQTRFSQALGLVAGPLSRQLGDFRVELLEIRGEPRPLDAGRAPDADASPLAETVTTLRERYRDGAVPGIVVLSDGVETGVNAGLHEHDGPAVFTIPVGGDTPLRDQELVSLDLEGHALPGSTMELTATVVARGFGRDPITVRLLADGRPLDVRRVIPAADGLPVRVTFSLPPAGEAAVVYTVNVPARSGEAVVENNARHAVVQPIGRTRRVLFVQGAPGYEHTFLTRAWRSDPRLDVDAVVRKGQNERGETTLYVQAEGGRGESLTGVVPADLAKLFEYDALVLGNVPQDLLSAPQIAAVDAFVSRRGGGLLVLGARSFGRGGITSTPLGLLLPVSTGRAGVDASRASWPATPAGGTGRESNRFAPTLDGDRHPVLRLSASADESARRWSVAPPLAGVAPLGDPRPGAQVLAVASSAGAVRPVLAVQRYGEGRTMVFAGEATWRWRMQRPLDDRVFDTFWRQAARWLSAASPDPLALETSAEPQPGRMSPVSVVVRDEKFEPVRDASVDVVIRDEHGSREVLRATLRDPARGQYTAEWRPGASGLFHLSATARRAAARIGATERAVYVGAADLETADPKRQDDLLRRIAERTGGQLLRPDEIHRLGPLLRARAEASAVPILRDLWHGPWTFLALVGLLATEWGLRRRWGLR